MWLQEAEHSEKENLNYIIKMLMSMLACTALTMNITELSGLDQIYQLPVMMLTGFFLCIVYGIFTKYKKESSFYLMSLFILLAFTLIFRQNILEGLRLFWNQQGDFKTIGTGYVVSELETVLSSDQWGQALLCFSIFAGIICAVFCCLAGKFMCILLPAALFGAMVYWGGSISGKNLIFTLVAAMFLLLGTVRAGVKSKHGVVIRSWMVCGIGALLLCIAAGHPNVKEFSAETSAQIHQKMHERKYETKHTTLPEGKFFDDQEETEAVQALTVTMEHPEAMYLRGYTGGIFENNRWKSIDTKALAEAEDLLYWLNKNLFTADTQFFAAAKELGTEKNTITIQNTGACSQYMYVPFGLQDGTYLNTKNLNQSGVLADGERTYTYQVVSDEIEILPQVLEYLQHSDDAYMKNYRKAESAYRAFVYENYLQLPENVTLPLEETDGSIYQSATAAVLNFRYQGIPARYAEGYIITEDMAKAAENNVSIKVNSKNAAAWAEVYQDGIGWIPMNLIPGLEELAEEKNEQNNENDSQNLNQSENKEPEELPEDKKETEEPSEGFVTVFKTVLRFGLFIVILCICAALLFLIVRRKLLLKRREERYQNTDVKEAVSWIFSDTIYLLEKMHMDRGNHSLNILIQPIYDRFGEAYGQLYEESLSINLIALFSSRKLAEEHRNTALKFQKETIAYLKKEVSFIRKIFIKWILCLY